MLRGITDNTVFRAGGTKNQVTRMSLISIRDDHGLRLKREICCCDVRSLASRRHLMSQLVLYCMAINHGGDG
jgi:hypothetical protein